MANYIFKRIEKKYMLDDGTYNLFLEQIRPYIVPDKFSNYTLCNVYFDTENYELIRTSLQKPNYKEKMRIRSYGVPSKEQKVFLELKKKYKKVVYKRRISFTYDESQKYLIEKIPPKNQNQIFKEIDYFIDFYKPVPKLFLAYDREAYSGKDDSELRITFDTGIRSRDYDLDLAMGDYGKHLFEKGYHLLEIKSASAYPIWLVNILSELEIYPTSFSKYGKIYEEKLKEKLCKV